MKYETNKDRILRTLRGKKSYSAQQLSAKLHLSDVNSVYASLSKLRQEGFDIVASKRAGLNRYTLRT